jgi:hypothetical protein
VREVVVEGVEDWRLDVSVTALKTGDRFNKICLDCKHFLLLLIEKINTEETIKSWIVIEQF